MVRTSGTLGDYPAGCSKRPAFSPAQPRRAETRLFQDKAAASEEAMRTLFGTESFFAKRERCWRTFSASSSGLAGEPVHTHVRDECLGRFPPSPKSTKAAGDAERGRTAFNGKGVCYYCHGIDGSKDQRPQLAADTAALIAQLNPQPVDLRNPKVLHLKTDKQRARAIREGHPGTGMFPDTTMTNQELTDTLTYLALLRREGALKKP